MFHVEIDSPVLNSSAGSIFEPLEPRSWHFDLESIALALSNKCRFGGRCEFYSVAQHSVLVSRRLDDGWRAMAGLFHDAAEAWLPDLPAPLKPHFYVFRRAEGHANRGCHELVPFGEVEARILRGVHAWINREGRRPEILLWPLSSAIEEADLRMRATERRDLFGPDQPEWADMKGIEPYAERIVPVLPAEAKKMFLDRHAELRALLDL